MSGGVLLRRRYGRGMLLNTTQACVTDLASIWSRVSTKRRSTSPSIRTREVPFPTIRTAEVLFLFTKAKGSYAHSAGQVIELPVASLIISSVVVALVHLWTEIQCTKKLGDETQTASSPINSSNRNALFTTKRQNLPTTLITANTSVTSATTCSGSCRA